MFKEVSPQPNFPELEEKILQFWQENKIFEKSIEQRPKNNIYSFYDGPPFITGLPHYGTLLSSIAKDIIPRYQTMKGKRVRRVWGWDCHGLPAEVKVEKLLGTKSKKDIEKIGVKKFNQECFQFVSKTSAEWEWYVDRIGRWVNFKDSYKTMDLSYMETVIWAFKKLYEKGLIYKGKRVSLFCPRCSTPLSKFEITMDEGSYREVKDPSIVIKFKLTDAKNIYILAWTTTPWTLPANFALAVDKGENYVKIQKDNNTYILAEKRFNKFFGEGVRVQETFKGEKLLGLQYEPLYNFFKGTTKDHKIYEADFVSMEEGTGVVHIAPGFGEEDTILGEEIGLSMADSIDDEGKFTNEVSQWAGTYFKDADEKVLKDLTQRNLLFARGEITHSYPFCYRCQSPLIYKTQEAWYVDIDQIRDNLLKTNKNINWVPAHFKHGRFEYNLSVAPHWCISRTRFWGTPLPVWECECGERYVLGSIKEIEELSGQKITDLHRPAIDEITIKCQKCNGIAKRVPEVLDCWMESGSMPYGEWHYPFQNKEQFEHGFPADFIAEYTGQLRAWFYYLHVLSNILFGSECFKNVIVTGVILGSDGKKMSKLLGNYPDPKMVLQKYGGDALRLYLMGSQIMNGEDILVSEKEIAEQRKSFLLLLWNCYKFFVTYANIDNWIPDRGNPLKGVTPHGFILDRWIVSKLNSTLRDCTKYMDTYYIPQAVRALKDFVGDLSHWYIRRSRDRFRQGDSNALVTLYYVLLQFSKMAAPVIPFITEEIYRNLTQKTSVHLENWPEVDESLIDNELEKQMEIVREIVEKGHAARKEANIPVRQPLAKMAVNVPENVAAGPWPANSKKAGQGPETTELITLIADELNIKQIKFVKGEPEEITVKLDTKLTPALIREGMARELIRAIQDLRKEAKYALSDKIKIYWQTESTEVQKAIEEFAGEIERKTLGELINCETETTDISKEVKIGKEKVLVALKISNF